ncbi:maleylpyruvate isomerase N-terminal domain-containing protein [Ferrimicrobium sp.]|uniref:maleylpyruvate isomerase N-terminal domain-containing protein n=1 Tax=Ferrimicrobium sp. TaxID=2926050 RepID=UPI00261D564B|nr:maleylpyruvate isomerase N-terminal domain-containing protein [Ferrimicrobium sp.]
MSTVTLRRRAKQPEANLVGMTHNPLGPRNPVNQNTTHNLFPEQEAFLETLEKTPPNALTACALWRAHELVAHLTAGAVEISLNLEAALNSLPIPATRSFLEREAPYREMADQRLRNELLASLERVSRALHAVLVKDPDAVVPWSGRSMVVATFVNHLRSELALHRWDLQGDDETGNVLLSQPELTAHAVTVLGKLLVDQTAEWTGAVGPLIVGTPDAPSVVVSQDSNGRQMLFGDDNLDPTIVADAGARLLLLWGRMPNDPRRVSAPGDPSPLAELRALLSGY